ncbi:MAG: hypothetical protein RJQ10_13220 [Haliea sp.]|uniref:hypothetical protein n=1 Tax=Haliea sp. TaxID=1932666 RepID=UPI0032EFA16C
MEISSLFYDATRAAYVRGELMHKRRKPMADWAKFRDSSRTGNDGKVVAIGERG